MENLQGALGNLSETLVPWVGAVGKAILGGMTEEKLLNCKQGCNEALHGCGCRHFVQVLNQFP